MNASILKRMIIFMIVLIFLIVFCIIYSKDNEKRNNEINNIGNDKGLNSINNDDTIIDITDFQDVNKEFTTINENKEYFTVKYCIEKYFHFISYLNINGRYEYTEEQKDKMREDTYKQIYTLLDDEYIQDFDITTDRLKSIYNSYITTEFYIKDIYKKELLSNLNMYVVYGKVLERRQQNNIYDYNLIVKIDEQNNTFSIYLNDYLEKNNYINLEEESNTTIKNIENISNKEYNVYYENDIKLDKQSIAEYYFSLYKNYTLVDVDYAYWIVEAKYKKLRFENDRNMYQQYLNEKGFEDYKNVLSKYNVVSNSKYTQIVCLDELENYYIFNIIRPGKFTVCLDNYTILPDNEKDGYDEAFPSQQCRTNVSRFFEAINDKNYNFAYSVISNSTKDSKFKTKEEFITYVKENWFENNIVDDVESTLKDDATYSSKITISDFTNKQNKLNIKFNIVLMSDSDFEISF